MANIEFIGEFKYSKEKITIEIMELIHRRLEYIRNEKSKLHHDRKNFQQIYNKSDEDFLIEFEKRSLGDKEDFFIWKSSISIVADLDKEETMLKEFL
ncbi:MAG: hypothetical protein ACTSWW_06990 [Promethearchaeota archaeon]